MPAMRPAAVAGTFYPGDAPTLSAMVDDYLVATGQCRTVKALVVPHAGYVYSGATAGRAYAALRPQAATIRRVVLFGPAHRVAVEGLAATGTEAFATPLGRVPVDRDAVAVACRLPQVRINDEAHAQEHSLEVQLPFLQRVLDQFAIVPFVVGRATGIEVAAVMEALWGGDETVIVVSSDLSHYLPYAEAQACDAESCQAIARLEPLRRFDQACGALPINGLIEAARRRGLVPDLIQLCNSGDTAGDKSRVVGYAAFAFHPS